MEELTIGDKIYISSKRAAEITGYAKDYVGQLCREGRVEATLVGRSWYVLEDSIRQHRFGGAGHVAAASKPAAAAEKPATTTWNAPNYSADATPLVPEMSPKMPVAAPITPVTAPDISDMQSAWREWFEARKEPLLETPEVVDAREEAHESAEEAEIAAEPVAVAVQESEDEPEPILKAAQETGAEPIALHTLTERPIAEEEERVPIHRFHEVYQTPQPVRSTGEPLQTPKRVEAIPPGYSERVEEALTVVSHKKSQVKSTPSMALSAIFISIIGLSLVITIIGSGYLDRFASQDGFQYSAIRILGGTTLINKASK